MKGRNSHPIAQVGWRIAAVLAIALVTNPCAWGTVPSLNLPFGLNRSLPNASAQDKKSSDTPTTKLKIVVTNSEDKPVGNASVYVRFNVAGGFMHKDKLAELSFKTNSDGSAKVPEVPQGKILIQVIAKGLHTYGKWYDIEKDQDTIEIKLEPAPHWY
ncbi:MAG: carboxypeptidase-like regulatory domain-containing protein [Candidatus Acidiferrales bacterium]